MNKVPSGLARDCCRVCKIRKGEYRGGCGCNQGRTWGTAVCGGVRKTSLSMWRLARGRDEWGKRPLETCGTRRAWRWEAAWCGNKKSGDWGGKMQELDLERPLGRRAHFSCSHACSGVTVTEAEGYGGGFMAHSSCINTVASQKCRRTRQGVWTGEKWW